MGRAMTVRRPVEPSGVRRSKRMGSMRATPGTAAILACAVLREHHGIALGGGAREEVRLQRRRVSQPSSDTRNEWTMIAMAAVSATLTTIPDTIAERCPGRLFTWARANVRRGASLAGTWSSRKREAGLTASTAAASASPMERYPPTEISPAGGRNAATTAPAASPRGHDQPPGGEGRSRCRSLSACATSRLASGRVTARAAAAAVRTPSAPMIASEDASGANVLPVPEKKPAPRS